MHSQINRTYAYLLKPKVRTGHPLSWLKRLAGFWKLKLRAIETRRRDRAAIGYLLSLKESDLSDIGITRDDVVCASLRPSDEIATSALNEIARRRHKA